MFCFRIVGQNNYQVEFKLFIGRQQNKSFVKQQSPTSQKADLNVDNASKRKSLMKIQNSAQTKKKPNFIDEKRKREEEEE